MSKDPYANYVVKTAMEVLEEGKQRDQLYAVLLSHQAELVSSFPFYTVVNTPKRDPHFGPFFAKCPLFCHKEEVPFAKHIVAMLSFYRQSEKDNSNAVKAEEK
jgi:hypothetical protein